LPACSWLSAGRLSADAHWCSECLPDWMCVTPTGAGKGPGCLHAAASMHRWRNFPLRTRTPRQGAAPRTGRPRSGASSRAPGAGRWRRRWAPGTPCLHGRASGPHTRTLANLRPLPSTWTCTEPERARCQFRLAGRAVEDVADGPVRAAPHLLQVELLHARLVRRNGGALPRPGRVMNTPPACSHTVRRARRDASKPVRAP